MVAPHHTNVRKMSRFYGAIPSLVFKVQYQKVSFLQGLVLSSVNRYSLTGLYQNLVKYKINVESSYHKTFRPIVGKL